MRKSTITAVALAAALPLTIAAGQGKSSPGANAANSVGPTTLDTTVGWEAGSGQFDGEFITAERQGVIIGLRAQQRFQGLLDVTGTDGDRVGVYEADTGSTGGNNGTWNYDWHVDVSASGRELTDYTLALQQDFSAQSLFGVLGSDPVQLPMPATCAVATETRCQQSWNPGFGNDDFDPDTAGTYDLRLVLTPETFNGPPLAVAIQVDVVEPATQE